MCDRLLARVLVLRSDRGRTARFSRCGSAPGCDHRGCCRGGTRAAAMAASGRVRSTHFATVVVGDDGGVGGVWDADEAARGGAVDDGLATCRWELASSGGARHTSKADLSWYPPAGTSKQIHHEPNQPEQLIRPHTAYSPCHASRAARDCSAIASHHLSPTYHPPP